MFTEEELEVEEEDTGEEVLASERDRFLSSMNHGIVYQNISRESLL